MSGQGRHFGIVEGVRSGEDSGRRIGVLAVGPSGGRWDWSRTASSQSPCIAASARPSPHYTHPSTARLVPFYNCTLCFCSLTFPRHCQSTESRVKVGFPDIPYSTVPFPPIPSTQTWIWSVEQKLVYSIPIPSRRRQGYFLPLNGSRFPSLKRSSVPSQNS